MKPRGLPFVAVLLSVVAQSPILFLFFWGDDFYFFFKSANETFFSSAIELFGSHIPIVKNLLFLGSLKLFGMVAPLYFLQMLALHCLNVVLLYKIILLITSRPFYSCFFASLWGINPILKGALGWYCAVGHVLSTVIILLAVHDVLSVTWRQQPLTKMRFTGWLLLIFAAALTWGTGIGVSGAFGLALFFFLQGYQHRLRWAGAASLLAVASVGAYLGLTYVNKKIGNPHSLDAFLVFNYLSVLDVLSLLFQLFTHGLASVLGGPLVSLASSHPSLLVLHLSALAIFSALTIGYARRANAHQRATVAGLAVVVASIYGIIALGRVWDVGWLHTHSTIISANARFHYTATPFITILMAQVLSAFVPQRSVRDPRLWAGAVAILSIVTVSSITLSNRITEHYENHEVSREEYNGAVRSIRESVLKQPEGSRVFIPNTRLHRIVPYFLGQYYFPHLAAVYIMTWPGNTLWGREVYFVDDEKSVARIRQFRPSRATRLVKTAAEARAMQAGQ